MAKKERFLNSTARKRGMGWLKNLGLAGTVAATLLVGERASAQGIAPQPFEERVERAESGKGVKKPRILRV